MTLPSAPVAGASHFQDAPPCGARASSVQPPLDSKSDVWPRDKSSALPDRDRTRAAHLRYLDSLQVPKLAEIAKIAQIQERKEQEVEAKYAGLESGASGVEEGQAPTEDERAKAAGTIQRTYRGYRARRQLEGLSLDPTTRWVEAIREARYRNETAPRPRESRAPFEYSSPSRPAHRYWQHVSKIARHAHGEIASDDDDKSSLSSADSPSRLSRTDSNVQSPSRLQRLNPIDKATRTFHRREEIKEKNAWKGKMMDLPYFLEMVDLKHRYGSNLRRYHEVWKATDTHENFFYWLDYGDGKTVEVPGCSRDRLDREQVRYLSREERGKYLVDVDEQGKLRWMKNGELIDTTEEFRDSIEGIVKRDSGIKTWREDEIKEMDRLKEEEGESQRQLHRADASSFKSGSESDTDAISSGSEGSIRYPDPPEMQKTRGPKKIVHVTPAVILNRLLRKSVKKNTWIFVADTNMNLYVGIKQSGSFQHSSFMHGSRISAAGLIKVKRGQLRSLSPLSGHYRPPASAFRHFVAHLHEVDVDMARVSVSKSYAVLVGLEAYIGTKKQAKKAGKGLKDGAEWVLHPERARERKEMEKDKSESARIAAEKEREEQQQNRPFGVRMRDMGESLGNKWADAKSRPSTAEDATCSTLTDEMGKTSGNQASVGILDRSKGELAG